MPELPEVEVTRQSFASRIAGARIVAVRMGKPLRWPLGVAPESLVGQSVRQVRRRGKYLLLDLDHGVLLLHLGMSGSLNFATQQSAPGKHDHMDIETTQGLKAAMPRYTQAVMDLGATLCLPKKPACAQCPVQHLCQGFAQGEPERMPVKTRKLKRSSHALWLLWAVNSKGQVWLEKRADTGIWAGLYCLPVWPSHAELTSALPSAAKQNLLAPWKHVLTHKDLHLHPVKVRLQGTPKFLSAQGQGRWWSAQEWPALGLPAPVRQLLSA